MIIEQRVKDFEKLEFGLFVHFGLYSILGRGEWALNQCDVDPKEYERLAEKFNPDPDWARELAATAKAARLFFSFSVISSLRNITNFSTEVCFQHSRKKRYGKADYIVIIPLYTLCK